jgi:hypothetical protein
MTWLGWEWHLGPIALGIKPRTNFSDIREGRFFTRMQRIESLYSIFCKKQNGKHSTRKTAVQLMRFALGTGQDCNKEHEKIK